MVRLAKAAPYAGYEGFASGHNLSPLCRQDWAHNRKQGTGTPVQGGCSAPAVSKSIPPYAAWGMSAKNSYAGLLYFVQHFKGHAGMGPFAYAAACGIRHFQNKGIAFSVYAYAVIRQLSMFILGEHHA